MFDRREYKRRAREALRGHWKLPVVISLISGIAVGILFSIISPANAGWFTGRSLLNEDTYISTLVALRGTLGRPLLLDLIFAAVVVALYGIIGGAYIRFFIRFAKDRDAVSFDTFFEGFSLASKSVRAFLWNALWIWLWTLLFFIPGIVKSCAYSMQFFILYENPAVEVRKSMRLSIEMTRGYKGELFVMGLSFIGWWLLPYAILIGLDILLWPVVSIGMIWSVHVIVTIAVSAFLLPYMVLSFFYAYLYLKNMALANRTISIEDLTQ